MGPSQLTNTRPCLATSSMTRRLSAMAHARLVAIVRRRHLDEAHDRVRIVADAENRADLRVGREARRMQIRERLVTRVPVMLGAVVLGHAVGRGDDVGERRGGAEVDARGAAVVRVEHAGRAGQEPGNLHAGRITGQDEVGPEAPRGAVEREVALDQLPGLTDAIVAARLADRRVRDAGTRRAARASHPFRAR